MDCCVGGPERFDEFQGQGEHLAVTLSLSPDTRYLIDERRLHLMKPTASLFFRALSCRRQTGLLG